MAVDELSPGWMSISKNSSSRGRTPIKNPSAGLFSSRSIPNTGVMTEIVGSPASPTYGPMRNASLFAPAEMYEATVSKTFGILFVATTICPSVFVNAIPARLTLSTFAFIAVSPILMPELYPF